MALRELDRRTADAGRIAVALDWDDSDGRLELTISDRNGTRTLGVNPEDANWALQHPYAYEAETGR